MLKYYNIYLHDRVLKNSREVKYKKDVPTETVGTRENISTTNA